MLLLDDIKSQQIPPRCLDAKKLLITGPVGVGKTTIAKALAARAMGVEHDMRRFNAAAPMLESKVDITLDVDLNKLYPFDFHHINGGDDGIDKIRDLALASQQSPSDPRCRCRAFVIDEIHALPDKAVQALLLPLERDVANLWVACTSRPRGALDAALRSRFSCHLDLGAADVRAVMLTRGCGEAKAASAAKAAQGDLRLALGGGSDDNDSVADSGVLIISGQPRISHKPRFFYTLAIRNPYKMQAEILDALIDYPEQHTQMCVQLSPRNDIAAHQLVAAARRAKLL